MKMAGRTTGRTTRRQLLRAAEMTPGGIRHEGGIAERTAGWAALAESSWGDDWEWIGRTAGRTAGKQLGGTAWKNGREM